MKRIEPNGPVDVCQKVSVGDFLLAIDGESVSGKSLSQLAQTVLGTPDTTIECCFRKQDTQEMINISLVRGVTHARPADSAANGSSVPSPAAPSLQAPVSGKVAVDASAPLAPVVNPRTVDVPLRKIDDTGRCRNTSLQIPNM